MQKLKRKVAVVTGGASGIGLAIVRYFALEGANVAIVDMNQSAAQSVVRELHEAGLAAIAVQADVRKESDVDSAFQAIEDKFGDTQILVNNAGIDKHYPFVEMQLADWQRMFDVHVNGTFLCTRRVLPKMLEAHWGRIINMSSQLAHKGATDKTAYCSAKAAILGFTKALATEVASKGITVNSLNPGPIETPLSTGIPQDWLAAKIGSLPIKRQGRPEEVAAAAVLLASDDGAFFIGSTLNMNGGDYMI